MIFYMSNIVKNYNDVFGRESKFSSAARNRSEYVMSNISSTVEVISLAIPTKKGVYKSVYKQDNVGKPNNKNRYFYPFCFNLFKLRYLTITFSILFKLLKQLKQGDLIICYNANIMYVFPIIVCRKLRDIKVIFEIEELYSQSHLLKGFKSKIMRFTENYMLKYSDGYIYTNERIKKYINDSKPNILNYGYNMNINNLQKDAETSSKKIVIYSGRLDYEGGIEIFLDSIQHISSDVKIIITGDGVNRKVVENFISSHIDIDIEYLGFIDDKNFDKIMRTASVGVNPLRLNCDFSNYSFPSKVLMYLSYGCNVVSSKSNNLMYLINEFENLFSYDEDSCFQLAEKINLALETPINREKNFVNIKNYFKKSDENLQKFFSLFFSSDLNHIEKKIDEYK